jgi:hypothetical protein
MDKVTCPHWTRRAKTGPGQCALHLYGSKPYVGNCQACQRAGHNTPSAAAALLADRARTHPPGVDPISGCCDRADQA